MTQWIVGLILAAVVAGAYGAWRTIVGAQVQSGANAEKARQAQVEIARVRESAKAADRAGDIRHEVDRGSFGDAVDDL
jgi:hypothetical protein